MGNIPREGAPILLTGATSHTGRRVARRLAEKGLRLRCLLHEPARRARIPDLPGIEIVEGSVADAADLERLTDGIETVVHIAHIRYAPALVGALERRGAPVRLIAMSSTRLLSRFETPVREEVRRGEEAIRNAAPNVRWTILRPSMIYGGPSDNNIERMARMLRRWRVAPVVGSGRNLWQPIFVWDLVDAVAAALERPETAGRTYTLAGPEPMAYCDVVRAVARASGAGKPLFIRVPWWAARALAGAWTLARPRSLVREMVERFAEDRAFDTSDARRDLGFHPLAFEEGLARKFRREV